MKSVTLLFLALLALTQPIALGAGDDLQSTATDTESLWRSGSGAHDGAYTAVSTSMIGWGLGVAAGIATLAAVLNHSSSSGSSSSGHCHSH